MTYIGLWRQGNLGPYLPMSETAISIEYSSSIKEYLNSNCHQLRFESEGFIYIPTLKSFYFLAIQPKWNEKKQFRQAFAIIIEIIIDHHLISFFLIDTLSERLGLNLQKSHYLARDGKFEDIVSLFLDQNYDQIFNVSKSQIQAESIDTLRMASFNMYSLLAFLLNRDPIYILNDQSDQYEILLHLLNVLIGDIVDINTTQKLVTFPIHLIDSYDDKFIEDRKEYAVVITPKTHLIQTDLEETIHHNELKKYHESSFQNKLLQYKGYLHKSISDYFHIIRSYALKGKISSNNLFSIVEKFSFHKLS